MTNGWKNPPNHFLCAGVPFPFYTWKKEAGGLEKKQIVRDMSVSPDYIYLPMYAILCGGFHKVSLSVQRFESLDSDSIAWGG